MSHRGGNARGGGYTRGSSGFRQKGRNSGSPYWKDKPTGFNNAIETDSSNTMTPVRQPLVSSDPLPEQSPADEGRQNKEVKKFSNKSRLFIANLPRDTSEDELKELFSAYGEVQEVFIQKEKSFGFCRMAYKSEAEAAIAALNGYILKGREMKVRMAANTAVVKVDNIHAMVTNELLEDAFSQFGEVEEAVVVTDIRGKSKGWGIVEFVRKQSAMNAVSQCKNCPFFLTRTPVPVVVTEYERDNYVEGQPFKSMAKTTAFQQECDIGPRFATPGDMEFIIGQRWLTAFEDERIQRNELERLISKNREEVKKSLMDVREQHQTELMRQELAHHQQEQMRLLMQLRDREGGLLHLPGPPPPFSGDRPEGDHSRSGVGAPPLFPQPLMGQPGFENFR